MEKRIYEEIKISSLVESLISEIDHQTIPLFELWEKTKDEKYFVTFNSLRIIAPIIESASYIEFNKDPFKLLKKLGVPKSEIVWTMFRHGLSHTIRPFWVEIGTKKYNWGIKNYSGNHNYNEKMNNLISISPRKLLDDLRKYLENFRYNDNKIKIQVGVIKI